MPARTPQLPTNKYSQIPINHDTACESFQLSLYQAFTPLKNTLYYPINRPVALLPVFFVKKGVPAYLGQRFISIFKNKH